MSEQREDEEQEVMEGEEEEEEEEEEEGEPGGADGEEAPAHRSTPDVQEQVEEADAQPEESQTGETDVLTTVEEAETQADLPDDTQQRQGSVGSSTATVKVVLAPGGHVMTVAFAIGLSIQDLKRHLAAELRVPAEVLQISLDGRVVEETQSLMELGVRPHGSTRLEMSSTDPSVHPLCPLPPSEQDVMPDVITVRVQRGDGAFQEVVVEVERPRQQKAFVGGYRHRLTGVEYHHAAVQTLPKRRPDRGVVVFSRDSQTVELKSQVQQCPVDVSTQMTGIGCYVSCVGDKLVAPGNYVTAEEYHDRRLKAVICLQSYARRWLAQQEVEQIKRERGRRLAWMELQERRRREEREEQLRDRRQRWLSPQKREDFNLLYHALEKWRCEEEQHINLSLRGAERKAALCLLLQQETQLIATIGRHRIAVHNNNYDKTIRSFLDKCQQCQQCHQCHQCDQCDQCQQCHQCPVVFQSAAPLRWRAADGRLLQMDTEDTIRARELRDLYNDVSLPEVSQEQRLHVLMTLKHTVMEHQCPLTQDIVDLIDREVDLMTRGLEAASLEGLRRRISTLFLQYIKTPAFNPKVAKLLKVPQKSSSLKNDMFLCRSCRRYLRSADFTQAAGVHLSSECKDCVNLNNIARARDDFSCYKNILRRLRAEEQRLNQDAKIPFLLQVEDIKYLVEVVWASRSALHASTDLYNLVFVRWDPRKDWSPWNCILLSNEERIAHLEVQDVHKTYEATLIHGIGHKHMLARRHFSQIATIAPYLGPPQASATLDNQLVSKPRVDMTEKLQRLREGLWNYHSVVLVVLTPLLLLPLPLVVGTKEAGCAFVLLLMAIYWVTEVIPLSMTAMIPAVLFPMFGIMKSSAVAKEYFKDFHFLLVGVICLATSIEKWGLHRRIALRLVTMVGVNPAWLMLGFMSGCAFLSMWVQNTSAVMMVMPIVEAVLQQILKADEEGGCVGEDNPNLQLDEPGGHFENMKDTVRSKRDLMMCKAMCIGMAYSSNIGGITTLPGTSPNLIFSEYLTQIYPECNCINFGNWLLLCLPISVIMLLLTWVWLYWLFIGSEKYESMISWPEFQASMPWRVALLVGGGFALAEGTQESGLSLWVAELLTPLGDLPVLATIAVACIIVTTVTEVASNVATITIFLPILSPLAEAIHVNPLYVLIPTTLCTSFSFLLPVSNPPNAVVFAYGHISIVDMVKAGLGVNVIGVLTVLLAVATWGVPLFSLDSYPDWAPVLPSFNSTTP
ncbi:hypothetical protein INR49_018935 [Caranx melampygus]|nr:hypothetical protein INR49_018935 [Caranx melampygus]